MSGKFICIGYQPQIISQSNEPNRNKAHQSHQNVCDKQTFELRKIDDFSNHIFLLVHCILLPTSILLSTNAFLTTLPLAICRPTASSNNLYISVHHQ